MDMLATAIGPGPAARPPGKGPGAEGGAGAEPTAGSGAGEAKAFYRLVAKGAAEPPEDSPGKAEADKSAEEEAAASPPAASAPAAPTPPLAPVTVLNLAATGSGDQEPTIAVEAANAGEAAPAQSAGALANEPQAPSPTPTVDAKAQLTAAPKDQGKIAASGEGKTESSAFGPGDDAQAGSDASAPTEAGQPEMTPSSLAGAGLTKEAPKAAAPAAGQAASAASAGVETTAAVQGLAPEQDRTGQDGQRQDNNKDGQARVEAGTKNAPAAASSTKADAPAAASSPTATAAADALSAEAPQAPATRDAAAALEPLSSAAAQTATTAPGAAARIAAHQQVGQQIVRRFDGGSMSIDLRLDPPDLGQVSVKLEVGADGAVKAAIGADTPAALAELVRGARELERALSQAGLSVERGALTFDLHDRSGGGPGQQDRSDRPNGGGGGLAESAPAPTQALTASLWRAARVDLIA